MRNPAQVVKNKKGAALLMALFTVMLIIFIAIEVSYDTAVEYRVASGDYHRLKAYYAAKSGVELSLLRIQLYKQVMEQYKDTLKGQNSLLDMIWQFPFMWPPQTSEDMTRISKEEIEGTVKDSFMDSVYISQISSEGAKIDINDLASPSEALRAATRKQLQQLLENRMSGDDEWAKENRDLDINELINNLQDWIDADGESLNGGDEKSRYPDAKSDFIPPNQPFKTLEELHMVDGMSDELFEIISEQVTVYGLKGINVNYADKKILQSIDAQITSEIADEILRRRNDPQIGPFKDGNDFNSFLGGQGVDINRFNDSQIPLYFDAEYNFRIKSTGQFGNSTREIIAIVYDFDTVKERLEKLLTTTTTSTTLESSGGASPTATPTESTTTTTLQAQKKSSGRPSIIYWYED